MGKCLIAYVAVFLLTLYCFFIYDDTILATMLVIEVVYLLISIIYLLIIKQRLRVSMEPLISVSEKNKKIPVTILVDNNIKHIPVGVKAIVKIENIFTGEKIKYKIRGKTDGNEMTKIIFNLKIKECGNIKITLEKVIVYDILFIFRTAISVRHTDYVGVLPESHLLPIEITRKTREFIADAEEYSDRESGDDPTELYQIREYREKDSIHDVHWKLSAKMDELLVKEHGKPLGCVALLWLDLSSDKALTKKKDSKISIINKKKNANKRSNIPSDLLELAASITMSLMEEKCVHYVAWYEPENKQIKGKRISREEHKYELMSRLLYVNTYKNENEVKVLYEEAFRGIEFSTIMKLDIKNGLTVNGENIPLPKENGEIKWEKLYFKV